MKTESIVISYLTLRKTIGYLGILLPFALGLGGFVLFGDGIQSSISDYYHTGMRDLFVGILFAIGFFLFSYNGYDRTDDTVGTLSWVFAIGTALFPTTPANPSEKAVIIGMVHLVFAALLFLTLAYFSLRLFTKSVPNPTSKKLQRNRIYRICGYTIIVCLGLVALYYALPDDRVAFITSANPIFWLESIAILAFGFSWLVKGEAIAILNDLH